MPCPNSIIYINLVNVFFVLWTSQIGRRLAGSVLLTLADMQPLTGPVSIAMRLVVFVGLGGVAALYVYTIRTMYLTSPLFMCDWSLPQFQHVYICEVPEVSVFLQLFC